MDTLAKTQTIIFLDIDGVLNTADHRKRQIKQTGSCSKYNWCPQACHNLVFLARVCRAKVVISSSWRHRNSLLDLKGFFIANDLNPHLIIGVTPAVDELDKVWDNPTIEQKYCRGYEIEEWILLNDPDCDYIIIDDAYVPSEKPLQKQRDRFIHVDSEVGFADFKAFNKAINILSNECS